MSRHVNTLPLRRQLVWMKWIGKSLLVHVRQTLCQFYSLRLSACPSTWAIIYLHNTVLMFSVLMCAWKSTDWHTSTHLFIDVILPFTSCFYYYQMLNGLVIYNIRKNSSHLSHLTNSPFCRRCRFKHFDSLNSSVQLIDGQTAH